MFKCYVGFREKQLVHRVSRFSWGMSTTLETSAKRNMTAGRKEQQHWWCRQTIKPLDGDFQLLGFCPVKTRIGTVLEICVDLTIAKCFEICSRFEQLHTHEMVDFTLLQ